MIITLNFLRKFMLQFYIMYINKKGGWNTQGVVVNVLDYNIV